MHDLSEVRGHSPRDQDGFLIRDLLSIPRALVWSCNSCLPVFIILSA